MQTRCSLRADLRVSSSVCVMTVRSQSSALELNLLAVVRSTGGTGGTCHGDNSKDIKENKKTTKTMQCNYRVNCVGCRAERMRSRIGRRGV